MKIELITVHDLETAGALQNELIRYEPSILKTSYIEQTKEGFEVWVEIKGTKTKGLETILMVVTDLLVHKLRKEI